MTTVTPKEIILKEANKEPSKELVDKLYNKLSQITEGKEINTGNIMIIATNLMQVVEKYDELKGYEKKNLIIYVLKKFVKDALEDDVEDIVLTFIDTMLPSVIDTIISIDKKDLAIKLKKSLKDCLVCC